MQGGPANNSGLDVAASAGTIIDTNASGTNISNDELIHNSPNNVSNGMISWTLIIFYGLQRIITEFTGKKSVQNINLLI